MTWKDSFVLHLMNQANLSKCACKTCWILRHKYLELAKQKVKTLEKSIEHYQKMGQFVGRKTKVEEKAAKHGPENPRETQV